MGIPIWFRGPNGARRQIEVELLDLLRNLLRTTDVFQIDSGEMADCPITLLQTEQDNRLWECSDDRVHLQVGRWGLPNAFRSPCVVLVNVIVQGVDIPGGGWKVFQDVSLDQESKRGFVIVPSPSKMGSCNFDRATGDIALTWQSAAGIEHSEMFPTDHPVWPLPYLEGWTAADYLTQKLVEKIQLVEGLTEILQTERNRITRADQLLWQILQTGDESALTGLLRSKDGPTRACAHQVKTIIEQTKACFD